MDFVWRAFLTTVGELQGKKVLEVGCGEGWSTLEYARRGAAVYPFDISPESVRNLMREITATGAAKQVSPAVMAAECLGYPDDTFDFVLGVAILHHTDLQYVSQEVERVLKPGGRALFIEPLAHNWLLQLFRWLTPQRRTPTEQPLTVEQIAGFGRPFREAKFQGYHLLSILPQGLLWSTGNQWLFRWSLWVTETVDRWLLKACPLIQRYCWAAIIEVKK
jgi:ubiquinone/menaquinone biosynthesis C-methylase UbiE